MTSITLQPTPKTLRGAPQQELFYHLEAQVADIPVYCTNPEALEAEHAYRFIAIAVQKVINATDINHGSILCDVLVLNPCKAAIVKEVQRVLGREWTVIHQWIPKSNCPF